jgi:hypothetical protein
MKRRRRLRSSKSPPGESSDLLKENKKKIPCTRMNCDSSQISKNLFLDFFLEIGTITVLKNEKKTRGINHFHFT